MGASLNLSLTPVSGSVSIPDNTSRVRIVLTITTNLGTYSQDGTTLGHIRIDDRQAASLNGKSVYINTTTTLYDAVHTIAHEADGRKTVAVTAYFSPETPGTANMTKMVTARLTLPHIPRCAALTVPEFTLDQPGTLTLDRASGFTCDVSYVLGGSGGVILEKSSLDQVVWTPPLDLAAEFPHAPSAEGKLTVTTWSGETNVGSREYPFTVLAPDTLGPVVESFAVSFTSDNGAMAGWDAAVKGKSRLRFAVAARGQMGADIVSCAVSCGGASGSGAEGVTGLLQQAGTFTPRLTATDSRGKTTVVTGEAVTVHDYAPPAFTDSRAFRADEAGHADGSGPCAAVTAAADFSPVAGRNTLTLRMRYRAVGGTWSGYTPLTAGELTVLPGFAVNTSYQVEVEAIDAVGESRTVVYTIPTALVAFHLRQGGSGAAFGKYAESDGWVESDWPLDMRGNCVAGLGTPTLEDQAVPLALLEQRLAAAAEETAETLAQQAQQTEEKLAALVQPDMVPGQEYLTAEKWNGAPVYAFVVDYGALPNAAEGENYALAPGLNVIDIRGFAVGPSYIVPIPGYYAVQNLGYTRDTGNLWVATTIDMSGYRAYITVKYTK